MNIIVDGKIVKTITDTEYKIITHTIPPDEFDADMARRYKYPKWRGATDKFGNYIDCIIQIKINNNIYLLRKEWGSRIENPAADNMEFCEQVFAHPDYRNRVQDEEASRQSLAAHSMAFAAKIADITAAEAAAEKAKIDAAVEAKLRELGIVV